MGRGGRNCQASFRERPLTPPSTRSPARAFHRGGPKDFDTFNKRFHTVFVHQAGASPPSELR